MTSKCWITIGIMTAAAVMSGCGKSASTPPGPIVGLSPDSAGSPLDQRIKAVIQPLIDDGWAQGMMVGVLQDGKEDYFAFGSISDAEIILPDENTVFEIGSVTKVFTAIVLADMATKGEASLSDPVEDYLPDDFEIPESGDKPITLGSLASHTSGLPAIPLNFWREGDNIYDNNAAGLRWSEYSESQLRGYFERPLPPLDDSRKYIYSNIGVGLLGFALAHTAEKPLGCLPPHSS